MMHLDTVMTMLDEDTFTVPVLGRRFVVHGRAGDPTGAEGHHHVARRRCSQAIAEALELDKINGAHPPTRT